jgi:hypothetical protein
MVARRTNFTTAARQRFVASSDIRTVFLLLAYLHNSILIYIYSSSEPGSIVNIVSGYGLDDQAIRVRSPAEAKGFFL